MITRDQCENAKFSNGSHIVKVWSESGDANKVGTEGTILGSIGHPELGNLYFVEWDTMPNVAVAVMEAKLGVKLR